MRHVEDLKIAPLLPHNDYTAGCNLQPAVWANQEVLKLSSIATGSMLNLLPMTV